MSDNESFSGNAVVPKKWYTANLGHEFLDGFGEFDLKKFKFPALSTLKPLVTLNTSELPDQFLKGVDVKAALRIYATAIGNSIKDAFHVAIPNHVLRDISKEFTKIYPNITTNFDRMLKDRKEFGIEDIDKPNKGKQEKRFKHVGDCLYKCLELWKIAHKSAQNRDDTIPPEQLFRQGEAHASLVQALKDRREISKNERDARSSGKASLREKFARLEADNATLKQSNSTLVEQNESLKQSNSTLVEKNETLELRNGALVEENNIVQRECDLTKKELDDLKIRFGEELDSEQHRLQLKDKPKKVQDKEVDENNVGSKRRGLAELNGRPKRQATNSSRK